MLGAAVIGGTALYLSGAITAVNKQSVPVAGGTQSYSAAVNAEHIDHGIQPLLLQTLPQQRDAAPTASHLLWIKADNQNALEFQNKLISNVVYDYALTNVPANRTDTGLVVASNQDSNQYDPINRDY